MKNLLRSESGRLRAFWRILLFVVVFTLASVPPGIIATLATRGRSVPGGLDALGALVSVIAALVATWAMLAWVDHRGWREVGLDREAARPPKVALGFLIGGGAIAAAILALIAVGWLKLEHLPTVAAGHPTLGMIALLVPAALAEEVLSRGYILTALHEAVNWPFAVAVTSVGFGLLHAANPGADVQSVMLVTLAGVFLAVIRIATGSLYAAWAAHFAWNWVMAGLFHASVSGVAFATPGYRYVDAGPDWATGGVWGPEGGVFAGVAMVAGTLLMWRRRPVPNTEKHD